METDGTGHLGESGTVALIVAVECVREVPEEPRPSLTAAADDDAVAAGARHHLQRVLGGEDVAVAEHRDAVAEVVLEPGDRLPVRGPGVEVGGRAPVEGDRRDPGVAGGLPRVEVGVMVGVDALAHLHRQRDPAPVGFAHRGGDDRREEVLLPRQGRAAALPGDLGHRAAEVEVDVVGAVLLDEHAHGLPDRHRVDAVELDRARGLIRFVVDDAHALGARSTSAREVTISVT